MNEGKFDEIYEEMLYYVIARSPPLAGDVAISSCLLSLRGGEIASPSPAANGLAMTLES